MTSMNARTLIETAVHIPVDVSILIRGPHGIGKSSIVKQLTKKYSEMTSLEYNFIDKRLSQQTEGDILGLPSLKGINDDSVTKFNPPDWYVTACREPTILFFDELNRATHEIMQASFQIVLDRELSEMKLHPMTRVFAAINTGASYTVNDLDPALLDRFWTIDLDPDVEDWIAWAKTKKISSLIIGFIEGNKGWLDPPKNANLTEVHPSRRSWERLDESLKHAKVVTDPTNPLFYQLSVGFIGTEVALALVAYAKDTTARITGEDVIERYLSKSTKHNEKSIREKFTKLPLDQQTMLLDYAADYAVEHFPPDPENKGKDGTLLVPWEKKHTENMLAFMDDLIPELKYSFWSKLTERVVENLPLLDIIHKSGMVQRVLELWNAGPGKTPVTPEFAKHRDGDEKAALNESV